MFSTIVKKTFPFNHFILTHCNYSIHVQYNSTPSTSRISTNPLNIQCYCTTHASLTHKKLYTPSPLVPRRPNIRSHSVLLALELEGCLLADGSVNRIKIEVRHLKQQLFKSINLLYVWYHFCFIGRNSTW